MSLDTLDSGAGSPSDMIQHVELFHRDLIYILLYLVHLFANLVQSYRVLLIFCSLEICWLLRYPSGVLPVLVSW